VLTALEAALAAPASRLVDWSAAVSHRLHELRGEFARHVEITEGPDGLYDEIVALAPEHSRALEALRGEHVEIEQSIRTTLARLADRSTDDPLQWVADRRQAGTDVVERLSGHRQRGIDLTWRAYNDDQGGAG
jgi:hypothetical protein